MRRLLFALMLLSLGLMGQDKSDAIVESITTAYFSGRGDHALQGQEYKVYNERGQMLEFGAVNPDGTRRLRGTLKYDENGNLLGVDNEYSSDRYTYEYDEHGNWTKQLRVISSMSRELVLREIQYVEHAAEEQTRWDAILPDGLSGQIALLTEYKSYLSGGDTIFDPAAAFKSIYRFERHGNTLSCKRYNSQGQLLKETLYQLDNLIETQVNYNTAGEEQERRTIERKENGDKLEHRLTYQGRVKAEEYYFYSDGGDLIQVQKLKSGKSNEYRRYTYQYLEYDELGNWTKREEYIDEVLDRIVAREITYY